MGTSCGPPRTKLDWFLTADAAVGMYILSSGTERPIEKSGSVRIWRQERCPREPQMGAAERRQVFPGWSFDEPSEDKRGRAVGRSDIAIKVLG